MQKIANFKPKIDGLIYVQSTLRNTNITVTDIYGNPYFWYSSGRAGFKGSRRSTKHAAETTGTQAGIKALQLGILSVEVIIIGKCSVTNPASVLLSLKNAGINILKIRDKTPIPHNGCRPPKRRRV